MIFVVGDFTAMIGDPTGRSKTRPALTEAENRSNANTYKTQVFKVLDRTGPSSNSTADGCAAGSEGLIKLAAKYNVAQMIERREFRQRFESGQPIAMHEFLYPLAQAYDSVALEADVELGGTDQLFNLNVGRDIMPSYGLPPQIVMTTPLLEGLDGVEKMSKSLGNYVGVTDPPNEMFGKLMSVSDDLMWRYYLLLTELTSARHRCVEGTGGGAHAASEGGEGGSARAASSRQFHDASAADLKAAAEFDRVHAQRRAAVGAERDCDRFRRRADENPEPDHPGRWPRGIDQ